MPRSRALEKAPPEHALRGRLLSLPPEPPTGAAVAVVLRDAGFDTELLLIERGHRPGDPWSGHLAFPGGMVEPGDASLAHAAARESAEEVGLTLDPREALGSLKPVWTGQPKTRRPMKVYPVVFAAPDDVTFVLDPKEVERAFWVSLGGLASAPRQRMWHRVMGVPFRFPWVWVRGRRLWGLTLQMVEDLLRRWPSR